MQLFLIRHAKAADGSGYAEDGERPLTAEGRTGALAVGNALAAAGVTFDAIVTSPLVRAVETAELIAVALAYTGQLDVSARLEPGGRTGDILDEVVGRRAGVARLALVGHEPSMGRLLSVLLGRPGLSLSKGAAVRLDYAPGGDEAARFHWVIKPKKPEPVASLDGL
jgi:phosphohistidine phosphatase